MSSSFAKYFKERRVMAISLIYTSMTPLNSVNDKQIEFEFAHLILPTIEYDDQFKESNPTLKIYNGQGNLMPHDAFINYRELQFENQAQLDLYMQSPYNLVDAIKNFKNDPEVAEYATKVGAIINDVFVDDKAVPRTDIRLI